MVDPRLASLDEMMNDPDVEDIDLYDVISSIATDVGGLRLLVDRYRGSTDDRVRVYVAMMLSRAAWDPQPMHESLNDLAFDLVEGVETSVHVGTVCTTLNALAGLNSNELLQTEHHARQALLARFLIHSLDQPNWFFRSAALNLLGHLWADQRLEKLIPAPISAGLKDRLASLAAEEETVDRASTSYVEDLNYLRPFWEPV